MKIESPSETFAITAGRSSRESDAGRSSPSPAMAHPSLNCGHSHDRAWPPGNSWHADADFREWMPPHSEPT
jgi:hypothetical protein